MAILTQGAVQQETVFTAITIGSADDPAVRSNPHFMEDMARHFFNTCTFPDSQSALKAVREVLAAPHMFIAVVRSGICGPIVGTAVLRLIRYNENGDNCTHAVVEHMGVNAEHVASSEELRAVKAKLIEVLMVRAQEHGSQWARVPLV